MKQTTLVDLGGVVFQSSGVSNNIIDWSIITQLNYKYGYDLNIGLDRFPDFLEEYNSQKGLDLDKDHFLKGIFDTLDFNIELIEGIRKHSEIIIVSDNYRENIEYISQRYEFASWSIKQFYSFDFALEKANPIFFEKLLLEIPEYKASELVFIDDSPRKLASAAKNGIRGIQFLNTQQALKDHHLLLD